MFKSYEVQVSPNNSQITKMRMNCGAARWAYNWALAKKKEAFDKKEKIPRAIELHGELVKLKKTEIPWMYDSSKCAPQGALRDCDEAFNNFFRKCKQKTKGKKGFPKFKSKKNDKQSFRLYGSIKVLDSYIQLPRIGKVKLAEKDYIPKNVKILSATISKHADRWFASVQVEMPDAESLAALNDVIGVDLGIKILAACSDGIVYENPKALNKNLRKLKRKQRQFSRKKKGSKNREKAKLKLAKLHFKISNIRKDCLHKITSKIINENQVIVLEDLKVSKMMKNHKLAREISDVGFYEFKRQIEYKAKWYGRNVILADTFYPSSKTCSSCGWKNEDLKLKDRIFECKICDMKLDRDLNASLNLKNLFLQNKQFYTGSSSGIQACGDGSSEKAISLSLSAKQEFNRKFKVIL